MGYPDSVPFVAELMRPVVALIVIAMLTACGQNVCTTPCAQVGVTPSPYVPTTPDQGFDVLITEHDRAVSLRLGQLVEVYLAQHPGMTRWSPLRADDPTVLQVISTDRIFPPYATVGTFVARVPGTTNVTATAGPLCSPGQACPAYAALFSVTVTVS